MNRRTAFVTAVWVVAVIVMVLLLVAVCSGPSRSRAEQCRIDGGHVTSEVERKRGVKYREYECIKDGREIDEWKVRIR